MKYLVGGSTGLLKQVETAERSVECCSPLEEQDLERQVTCMCWSGGEGGQEESEFAVGRANGAVEIYGYPSMDRRYEFKLDSPCVNIFIAPSELSLYGKLLYDKGTASNSALYPSYSDIELTHAPAKYICCVFQNGYCVILNYDLMTNSPIDGNCVSVEVKVLNASSKDDSTSRLSLPGLVAAYKLRGPITSAANHTVLRHRVVMGGPDVAPFLFDLFAGTVLWSGKLPHETLLCLKTHLDVRSICFLEDIGEDVIAVSTSDSSIYIYDMTCQRKPVYDMNLCDRRSRCLSAKQLALHEIRAYNTDRKKEIKSTVNEFYTSDSRNIVKLATVPRHITEEPKSYERRDTCDLFASDNVGSIYHLRIVTGDTLVRFLTSRLQKYQPSGEEVTREKALDHLIQARKRFGSAGANDRPLHCAPVNHDQYICELKGCYTIHNGAVVDITCVGYYLISVGLDRFTNVYDVRTRKRLFNLYCNQKQTCLLPFLSQYFQEYDASEFKQLEPVVTNSKGGLNGTEDDNTTDNRNDMEIDNYDPDESMDTDATSATDQSDRTDCDSSDSSEDSEDTDRNSEESSDMEDASSENYDEESDDT
ncbi:hypothetical protein X943_002729 [Babesia divergens]|uniref:Uncharacterized protein n=1 Tax=Babesia divergens TaxID=32595 RepID=A0AAD9LJC8_BABDI|nr:hypothetical protein X943_002729 [Babesia divergens]